MGTKEKREKRSVAAAARRRAEKHQAGFDRTSIALPDGAAMFQLKQEGITRIDILPFVVGKGNPFAEKGELHYERTFYVHRGIGPNGDSYVCLQKTLNKPCPVCEYRAKLAKDPEADEETVKSLFPKERQLFNVIDLKNKDKGVQIWDISYHLFGKLLDARIRNEEEDDYAKFADLDGGLTLKLGVEEKSFGGKTFYSVATIDFKPRAEEYGEEILKDVHCLDDLIKILDYDELKKVLLQTEDDDDDDDDDEKPAKKSSKDDDEDDDEDEDDEDDEEEEKEEKEEKPAKKSSKNDDEDEEEDDEEDADDDEEEEEEDEDEEEEKPAKKGKKEKEEDEDDEEEKPAKKSSKKDDEDEDEEEEKPAKKGKTCPVKGGKFGKDCDKHDACEDCALWDECDDASHASKE